MPELPDTLNQTVDVDVDFSSQRTVEQLLAQAHEALKTSNAASVEIEVRAAEFTARVRLTA